MPVSELKDLRDAEKLRREGKLQEALEVIDKIEKNGNLTPADQLSLLISKGKILSMYQRHGEVVRVGKLIYRLSQSLGGTNDTITSLLFKANCLFLGQYDKALKNLSEAESLLNSLSDVAPSYLTRQRGNILLRKSWAYTFKGDLNQALPTGLECLELQEKFGSKRDIAYTLQMLGSLYNVKGEKDIAFDYASRSLMIFEEIGDQMGMTGTLSLLGYISYGNGKPNQALKYCKKSLSSEMISTRAKLYNIYVLGEVYMNRGEIDKALRYLKQGITLAEKSNFYNFIAQFQSKIGLIYSIKEEYERAIEYLKPSLSLAEKLNDFDALWYSLLYLIRVNLERDAIEEAHEYLERVKKLELQVGSKILTHGYLLLRAMFLLKIGGSRNRTEAETLLKQISREQTYPVINAYSLIYLCEFYLDELNLFEDIEVLKEINPIIEQLYKISEEERMYGYLAEAKLLQAKVALIQMNFKEAQRLLTQAQRVAELYGITYTAQRISNEHDNYLGKLSEWKNLKETDAPVSERLKLASVEGILKRLEGKRTIEPPELVDEEPIVLLIMDKSGISYFNYSFRENWNDDWLFSSFMSAFETFSSEFFSESIDRIKIGDNVILINPIESFLVCYVIKGQSYPGLQKLNRFSKAIKEDTEIWKALNRAVKTGEILELDKLTSLGAVINEIFAQ